MPNSIVPIIPQLYLEIPQACSSLTPTYPGRCFFKLLTIIQYGMPNSRVTQLYLVHTQADVLKFKLLVIMFLFSWTKLYSIKGSANISLSAFRLFLCQNLYPNLSWMDLPEKGNGEFLHQHIMGRNVLHKVHCSPVGETRDRHS